MDIEVFDYNGRQHVISDAKGIKFSNHYGSNGSGFGYLKFNVERTVGVRYPDIGFGYIVKLRYGMQVVYKGMIREIGEKSKGGENVISVSAVGLAIIAEDSEEILRNFCSTDLGKWKAPGEIPSQLYRPDLFSATSSSGGISIASGTQTLLANQYSELRFEFFEGEIAERMKFSLIMNLGKGVTFDGQVDSVDGASKYVYYKNNSDETKIDVGMTLVNSTQFTFSEITAIDTGLNRITVSTDPSSWAPDDDLYISGPYFSAVISTVVAGVITYTTDIGEGNISTAFEVVNLTQKDSSGISSFDTGANTITASGDVSNWVQNDVIIIPAPIFTAVVSSISSTQITYSSDVGSELVSSDTGWVLYNSTKGEVATVDSWTAPDKVDVTDAGEISTWSGDTINIYSPYKVEVKDSNNTTIWPVSDWRDGAVPGRTTGIDIMTTLSPTSFRVLFVNYIAGTGDESSFARLYGVKVYSIEENCTIENLSKRLLSEMTPLGIDTSEADISALTKVIEPAVFEFKDIKECLSEICRFGSQNSKQVAWGIRTNDVNRFFVEEFPDVGNVKYVVAKSRGEASVDVTADMADSVQRVRGTYTDNLGNRVIMGWVQRESQYFGTHYISRTESISNVDNDQDAEDYLNMLLDEQQAPQISSSYSVTGNTIKDRYGNTVPVELLVADGSFIEVEDFRSAITGGRVSDLSANWVRDRLMAVEVDVDAQSAKLVPGKAKKTFEIYMSELGRIAKI